MNEWIGISEVWLSRIMKRSEWAIALRFSQVSYLMLDVSQPVWTRIHSVQSFLQFLRLQSILLCCVVYVASIQVWFLDDQHCYLNNVTSLQWQIQGEIGPWPPSSLAIDVGPPPTRKETWDTGKGTYWIVAPSQMSGSATWWGTLADCLDP